MAVTDDEVERDFNGWLNSIEFVDRRGLVVPAALTEDASPDPEGDRTEVED
jgi:hypothetical protein